MKRLWPVFILCLALIRSSLLADTLLVGIYDKPPYLITKEKSGIVMDIFREAATIAGVVYRTDVMPSKRLLLNVSQRKIAIEPGVAQEWRQEFDSSSLYSESYLMVGDVVVIHKDLRDSIRDKSDLQGKHIGCVRSYSYHEGFKEKFEQREYIREDTDSHRQNLLKLHYKRLDAIIIDRYTLLYYLQELHIPAEEFVVLYEFKKVELAIRVDRSHEGVLARLDSALTEMKMKNRIETLMKKYIE